MRVDADRFVWVCPICEQSACLPQSLCSNVAPAAHGNDNNADIEDEDGENHERGERDLDRVLLPQAVARRQEAARGEEDLRDAIIGEHLRLRVPEAARRWEGGDADEDEDRVDGAEEEADHASDEGEILDNLD